MSTVERKPQDEAKTPPCSVARRYFRGVEWTCHEGHKQIYATSLMRISRDRLGCIIGSMVRRGVWCSECEATTMPKEIGRVVRMDVAKETRR